MRTHPRAAEIASAVLIAVAVLYRIALAPLGARFDWLPNFAPTIAICLCGAIGFPRGVAVILPMLGLLLSDLALNHYYHVPLLDWSMMLRYAVFGGIACAGLALRSNPQVARIFGVAIAGSLLFYVATNTGAWLAHPGYAKTATGWLQAHTAGLPGYPPAWLFFRNALAGDLLFTSIFLLCTGLAHRPHRIEVPAVSRPANTTA